MGNTSPSIRQSSAMVSSPRNPSSTMRIFSSAEYCLRVARRISLIALAVPVCLVCDFCLIFIPLMGWTGCIPSGLVCKDFNPLTKGAASHGNHIETSLPQPWPTSWPASLGAFWLTKKTSTPTEMRSQLFKPHDPGPNTRVRKIAWNGLRYAPRVC